MKQKIVFATNNAHKLEEVTAILGNGYEVLSLREIGCDTDIPETADTFAGNALQKAQYVKEHYGYDCFADDSGLEVDVLDGAPGVYSARYSGGGSEANMDKLLHNLTGKTERGAQFRTVIALLIGEETQLFEGIVRGTIIEERRGEGGFGYDPIFVPEGYEHTFAQLGSEVKNRISHRAKAVELLAQYLNKRG
jgi:XTP/dITP diphosphohydrolase